MNYHFRFPDDYRTSPTLMSIDITGGFICVLSWIGWTWDLKRTEPREIALALDQTAQVDLERRKSEIDFGPSTSNLPLWTKQEFDERIAQGQKLIILDDLAHDVSSFLSDHPGGPEILLSKLGRDATIAFNGGVQRHSKAARNLAAMLRVARIQKIN